MILMCNKGIAESSIDQQRQYSPVFSMESHSPSSVSDSAADESPRVKFLCSFSGSILPRPQDGKLRYVGGETRIISVPRDIGFDELMGKMRELFDGAAVLKYQQPDEDLDALVSVVNDEDVVNMMEEYDKSGSGDGFTRLRIFLFSQPENDLSSHYDGDERETERRYVDALNNLHDTPDFRSPVMSPVDDLHSAAEQYFNSLSLEGSGHNQRNYEFPMPQYNLHHLSIPHVGSGQHHQMMNPRYSEMEPPWSPAYYSPRQHGHEPRPMTEFPSSPSSARYHAPFGELMDRMADEYSRQQVNQQQPAFEHQPQFSDNAGWLPPSALHGEKSAFPGNLFHGPSGVEGSSICEHCRMAFQRNFEHPSMNNGLHQVSNPCADCPPNREALILNADARLQYHGVYPDEQSSDSHNRPLYSEALGHERGWILQQQLNARADEVRGSISGSVRVNEYNPMDGVGINLSHGHVPSNYLHHRAGHEVGNEVFHDQTVAGLPHIHVSSPEETGVRYGNVPVPFVGENHYPTHGHVPNHPLRRNLSNQAHVAHSYEACNSMSQFNGKVNPGLSRNQWEGSPRFCVGMENQSPWTESSKMSGFEGKPEYGYGNTSRQNSATLGQESQQLVSPDPTVKSADMMNLATAAEPTKEAVRSVVQSTPEEEKDVANTEKSEVANGQAVSSSEGSHVNHVNGEISSLDSMNSSFSKAAEENADVTQHGEKSHYAKEDLNSADKFSALPELIASAKQAAVEGANDMKAKVEENTDYEKNGSIAPEVEPNELDSANAPADTELDSDSDNITPSTIEPTKAEAEAFDKGLQTIKNDDLEEIRELGSGTYGAVYHGKWRGSDVAIKRIKASCFAGRPSERERLIADFWKEALILSSLHHPNVVSFYGIVRDGPDGSLATVTEFMINGSLKQFLQKKDRTIDRRKRLIIGMDAAFGMEYLHGKNIVHFDLKCENLLVNMRDPQRPICKIGDLGLSKVKQHTLVSGGVRGTLPWMAPELLSGKSNMVTEKIDVYSFGIVMWELLTGEEPYADLHCASIIGGIVNNTLRPQVPTWCDPEWKSLMESCWAADPAQRPSFSEISQKLRNMAAAMNVK